MKRLSLLTAALLFVTAVFAYGQNTETRAFNPKGSFDAITVSGTQDVFFEIGPAGEAITVTGEKEDLDNTEITIQGNTLVVSHKKNNNRRSTNPVKVHVKNPTLKSAKISGTGDLDIKGKLDRSKNTFSVSGTGTITVESIDCKNLDCTVSGTGDIICPRTTATDITAKVSGTGDIELLGVNATTVNATSSGTGDVVLEGRCKTGKYTSSGTAAVRAEKLDAVDITVKSTGVGSVHCTCTGNFEGNAPSIGTIHLYGKPNNLMYTGNDKKLKKH